MKQVIIQINPDNNNNCEGCSWLSEDSDEHYCVLFQENTSSERYYKCLESEQQETQMQMPPPRGTNCPKCVNNSKLEYCMFCEQRGDLKDHYKPKKKLVAPYYYSIGSDKQPCFSPFPCTKAKATQEHGDRLIHWCEEIAILLEVDA